MGNASNLKCVEDDIVISGISGRFPESSNIDEFRNNLFNGIDMVNDEPRRWSTGLYGMSNRIGKIKQEDLESCDVTYFGVHPELAEQMDPLLRMLLEVTYEAIIDAGINPQDLHGSRTGVYVGVTESESEDFWTKDTNDSNGYVLIGCVASMFANRLSFAFNLHGPSSAIDTACSSSLFAINNAFRDIHAGHCDAAIVASANIVLKPRTSLKFHKFTMLSPDGACKAFDESANGFVRSDACVALFLQKAHNSRRVYSTILNIRTNTDGVKEEGITCPSGDMQQKLYEETYAEINLNPHNVVYIETHGTGTAVGDPHEANGIVEFFCKDRKTPLLIGSVKSNMGHGEVASGVCGIAKMLIAMEEGIIPGNLHYKNPNPNILGLMDGRLKVVDKNTPWNGGVIGLNSFGFGGVNVHLIMQSNQKPKDLNIENKLPRLAVVSGRTVEAVEELLRDIEIHTEDKEYLALFNEIHSKNIPRHNFRGYTVTDKDESLHEVIELTDVKRPIWFVYSGMGLQWSFMAKELMQIDIFRKSINRCAEALRPEGVDLIDILTKMDMSKFDILMSFIAITAVQVALTDVLKHLGITPDGIVGHSFGEVACAYADGCFTAEQAVLVSYWRGRSVVDTDLTYGMMASVGLTWEECLNSLPEDILPACHNSAKNVTISGPTKSVAEYVKKLHNEGIFAHTVNVWDRAFHSKYIEDAVPKFKKSLEKILPDPKERSSRWVSSSILENEWNSDLAKLSSAAYHANNFRSPVYFHEALQYIPENAICIEIAPHGILQGLLKQSLSDSVIKLSLAKRNYEKNLQFFLKNIGKLYAAGAQPDTSKLYQPVVYPVGRGTPMLSSKIRWDHSLKWTVPYYGSESTAKESVVYFNLNNKEDSFLEGHTLDGRIIFPAAGYIVLAWRQFVKTLKNTNNHQCVILENVVFHHATIFPADGIIKLTINLLSILGKFTICTDDSLVVSGTIRIPENIDEDELQLDILPESKGIPLNTDDFYKELRLRGIDYTNGLFRGVVQMDANGHMGKLLWREENWVTFIDAVIQVGLIGNTIGARPQELYITTKIEKIIINPEKHLKLAEKSCTGYNGLLNGSKDKHLTKTDLNCDKGKVIYPVFIHKDMNVAQSGGIEIHGIKVTQTQMRQTFQDSPTLERYLFVPNHNIYELSEHHAMAREHAIMSAVHLVAENCNGALMIKTAVLLLNGVPEIMLSTAVQRIIDNEPRLASNVSIVTSKFTPEVQQLTSGNNCVIEQDIMAGVVAPGCHLYIAMDILLHENVEVILKNLKESMNEYGFILLEESANSYKLVMPLFRKLNLIIISTQVCSNRDFILLRHEHNVASQSIQVVNVTEKNFDWVNDLKSALNTCEKDNQLVYIMCQGENMFGGMGFMKCLMTEPNGQYARLFFIQDTNAPTFALSNPFYVDQMEKNLTINVLKNGTWGTFRHLTFEHPVVESTVQVENAHVNLLTKGDLSSLNWIEGPPICNYPQHNDSHYKRCTVYYVSPNLQNVMELSGKPTVDLARKEKAKADCVLGLEFSGRDAKGNRIMAIMPGRSLATMYFAHNDMLWSVPESWTLEQASTVPIAYCTVYYALVMKGKIKKGETLLIHDGSSNVGQAAIRVALAAGLIVLTTVANNEMREFIKKTFPQLKDRHIGNSHDCSFKRMVMRQTKGEGVSLVLYTQADKLKASLECLGYNGRFLYIGKTDGNNDSIMGISELMKNISFHIIHLDQIFSLNLIDNNVYEIKMIRQLVIEGIKSGVVKPLQTTAYDTDQLQQAFQFMASGKYTGKVVIKLREEEKQKQTIPKTKLMSAIPSTYMHMDKTYVIIGGLGGLGLELIDWLVSKGARNIVAGSRNGIKTGYQSMMIRRWEDIGVNVMVSKIDVTTREGAQRILQEASKLGPIGGIFNLAVVLRDALFQDQTETDFHTVCLPKINATTFLDEVSRNICPDLDYFICFSSLACGRGFPGKTNYGLANSAMERICEARQVDGYCGTAIQWGIVGDTGIIIEQMGNNHSVIGGIIPQRMVSCLKTMDFFLRQPYSVLSSFISAENTNFVSSELGLAAYIMNILGFKDIKNISKSLTLLDLGMDSLMTTEIKQTLQRNYDIVINEVEIRKLTLIKLEELENKSKRNQENTNGKILGKNE